MSEEGAIRLCIAVIRKACEDYRDAKRVLRAIPASDKRKSRVRKREEAQEVYDECREFFLGDDFDYYCLGIDGKTVLEQLDKEEPYTFLFGIRQKGF